MLDILKLILMKWNVEPDEGVVSDLIIHTIVFR